MSHPREPLPVLPFIGTIHPGRRIPGGLLTAVTRLLGSISLQSEAYPFSRTDHYAEEMGDDLHRTFFFGGGLEHSPESLVERKIASYALEMSSAVEGRRRINLDPGHLNAHHVVIATFKNFAHRIYLGRGVYAHLEYLFHSARPALLPWTYPDFRNDNYRDLFAEARKIYMGLTQGGAQEHEG